MYNSKQASASLYARARIQRQAEPLLRSSAETAARPQHGWRGAWKGKRSRKVTFGLVRGKIPLMATSIPLVLFTTANKRQFHCALALEFNDMLSRFFEEAPPLRLDHNTDGKAPGKVRRAEK